MNFNGKLIEVRSENGPDNCIIDCQLQGRAFILDSGETSAAVIEGFTILNGNAFDGNGGGIDIALSTHPTIRNCVFKDCRSIALGGAVAVRGQCAPLIEKCTFINNVAFSTAEGGQGGGLCMFFLSPATVIDCVFIGNESLYGGGLSCSLSDATIVNCLVVDNLAYVGGGGVASDASNPHLVNCTIADNTALYGGAVAGITQYLESFALIDNCILWNNNPNAIEVLNGVITANHSNVHGGWPGVGNISQDPDFVDPAGGDYGLRALSPCIDAGNCNALPPFVMYDLAGNPRFVDDPNTPDTGQGFPCVDMGVYEFQPEPMCPADVNGDAFVDVLDLLAVLAAWGATSGPEDINGDGQVDVLDLLLLLAAWGPC
jgi:hypothetical protein